MELITRKEAKALGLKNYFTGEPCKHGHIATRRVCNGACNECRRLQTESWRNKPDCEKGLNTKTAKELPSQDELNDLFLLDNNTGKLYWKDRPISEGQSLRGYAIWRGRFLGKEAGYLSYANGYTEVRLPNKELHKAHRIIWKMVTGEEPNLKLDHINGDTTDNRFENLRQVTDQNSARNTKTYSLTGYKGVTVRDNKYIGYYSIDDVNYASPAFETPEEAARWYDNAVVGIYGEYAKLNFPKEF